MSRKKGIFFYSIRFYFFEEMMNNKKQPSLKSMQDNFKKNTSALKIQQLFLSFLYFFKIALVSFVSGRVLAYKKFNLFEVEILLIALVILVISRFFSSKIETKKVELEQLEQMISSKKSKHKKKRK